MMPFTPDNGPRVEVVPSTERRYQPWSGHGVPQWEDFPGFVAVCSCDWVSTFYAADDSHDRAHADATTEADEHAVRHGR